MLPLSINLTFPVRLTADWDPSTVPSAEELLAQQRITHNMNLEHEVLDVMARAAEVPVCVDK